jgi:predicted MFS family arabinose efflux permease
MKKNRLKKTWIIFLAAVLVLSALLLVFRDMITLNPLLSEHELNYPTYVSGNSDRIVMTENSEKSVVVMRPNGELVYKLNARPDRKSFSSTPFVALDEHNNLYVLDVDINGLSKENRERVLKFSPKGKFLGVIYEYSYINDNFISTVGRLNGLAYSRGSVYIIRLGDNGFWLEKTAAENQNVNHTTLHFFEYPNAYRDLAYFHINADAGRVSLTTKAGGIKQYDFNGGLVYERSAVTGEKSFPWTVVCDNDNNLIYADILTGEIVLINSDRDNQTVLFVSGEDVSPFYRLNYTNNTLFAAAYFDTTAGYTKDTSYLENGACEFKYLHSYTYSLRTMILKQILFAALVLDAFAVLALVFLATRLFRKRMSETLKTILLVGMCIAFGSIISAVLIINEMTKQYHEKAYNDLENISRLMASSLDAEVLDSIESPAQYNSEKYTRFTAKLRAMFGEMQFTGERVYQMIWKTDEENGLVYSMYDLESALGTMYPFDVYAEDSYYREVFENREYVHYSNVTSSGSWQFVCGPIIDSNEKVVGLIETGHDIKSIQEQTRNMVIQIILIVIVASIALLLVIIECILVLTAYKQNKKEQSSRNMALRPEMLKATIAFMINEYKKHKGKKGTDIPERFHPELLRAVIFFQFFTGNLAAAFLPMYSVNLYKPLFNLPHELVVALPMTTDMIFAAIALFTVPGILNHFGLKKMALWSSVLTLVSNILCFTATNTAFLAVAYALSGFSGGALLLVLNAIIGGRKDVADVNSGFAHFTASYLAGVNVGVVCGSIIAQFFPYRIVYLFSSFFSVLLFAIVIYAVRSKHLDYLFKFHVFVDRRKNSLLKFLISPVVLASLFLMLFPFVVSQSFITYFMPIFGLEHGLKESNIGQLLLLNGLFAILFGAALCEYAIKKIPLKVIVTASLVLNMGAIMLFTFNMSIPILVLVVGLLAIVNIFALTTMQTYYATLYQKTRLSSVKALSAYSAMENMSMAVGPVIFSYILAGNSLITSLRIFAAALLGSLVVFLLVSGISGNKKKPGGT